MVESPAPAHNAGNPGSERIYSGTSAKQAFNHGFLNFNRTSAFAYQAI
jgi:hypothetical protein